MQYSATCLVCTSNRTQNQYLLSEVRTYYQGWFVYMRYTQGQSEEYLLYYPGVCTKPGTYYQGWLMYMRYTQGQNDE